MSEHSIEYYLFMIGSAYLIGSIPFGYLVGRLFGLGDLRTIGSGNIGATNMVRAGGKKLGALVLLLDALKAALGFYWSGSVVGSEWARSSGMVEHGALMVVLSITALLAVFVGHMFPIWLKFRGGKGISIMIGSLLGLPFIEAFAPIGFLPLGVFLITWVACYLFTRTSSLSGLCATLSVVGYFYLAYYMSQATANSASPTYVFENLSLTVVYSFAALLVFYRHKDNIRRLLRGEELAFHKKEKEAA